MSSTSGNLHHDDIFVVSDLHLSDPTEPRLENFVSDAELERFVTVFVPERTRGRPASLVIAGDFVDFARIASGDSGSDDPAVGSTEAVSVEKAKKAISGHPRVFDALRRHLEGGHQLVILPGNHDVDVFWPGVRDAFRTALGASPALGFPDAWSIRSRGVYIEHGHQHSYDNRFERFLPFDADKCHLERAWGTFFMESIYNRIEYFAPWINKVHPTSKAILLALRSLEWDKLPPVLAARVIGFFLRHGKRMMLEHAMGTPSPASFQTRTEAAAALGIEVRAVPDGVWLQAERLAQVADGPPAASDDREPRPEGLALGHSDERGLTRAAHEQLRRDSVHTAIFGHTHRAHRKEVPGPKAWINTGTWTGYIPVPDDQAAPTFEELAAAARHPTHRRTYAYVGPGAVPGVLETFEG